MFKLSGVAIKKTGTIAPSTLKLRSLLSKVKDGKKFKKTVNFEMASGPFAKMQQRTASMENSLGTNNR